MASTPSHKPSPYLRCTWHKYKGKGLLYCWNIVGTNLLAFLLSQQASGRAYTAGGAAASGSSKSAQESRRQAL
jgi:hypothetical protein